MGTWAYGHGGMGIWGASTTTTFHQPHLLGLTLRGQGGGDMGHLGHGDMGARAQEPQSTTHASLAWRVRGQGGRGHGDIGAWGARAQETQFINNSPTFRVRDLGDSARGDIRGPFQLQVLRTLSQRRQERYKRSQPPVLSISEHVQHDKKGRSAKWPTFK